MIRIGRMLRSLGHVVVDDPTPETDDVTEAEAVKDALRVMVAHRLKERVRLVRLALSEINDTKACTQCHDSRRRAQDVLLDLWRELEGDRAV